MASTEADLKLDLNFWSTNLDHVPRIVQTYDIQIGGTSGVSLVIAQSLVCSSKLYHFCLDYRVIVRQPSLPNLIIWKITERDSGSWYTNLVGCC